MLPPALPSTPGEWKAAFDSNSEKARREGKEKANVSASRIENSQFLSLRVLWNVSRNPHLRLNDFFEDNKAEEFLFGRNGIALAQAELQPVEPWTAYLKHLADPQSMKRHQLPSLGVFALVDKHQTEVRGLDSYYGSDVSEGVRITRYDLRARSAPVSYRLESTPTRPGKGSNAPRTPPSLEGQMAKLELGSPFNSYSPMTDSDIPPSLLFPRARDEQIVNTALIDLLEGITLYLSFEAHWTLHRHAFKFDDWEARVDGYLESRSGMPMAIVEVKSRRREAYSEMSRIRMQEGAQMAAWIASDTAEEGCVKYMNQRRRILVSQDRDEIFVTFARYDEAYIDYIRRGDRATSSSSGSKSKGGVFNRLGRSSKNDRNDKRKEEQSKDNRDDGFLMMYELGPFMTHNPNHMRYLGWMIVLILSDMCRKL